MESTAARISIGLRNDSTAGSLYNRKSLPEPIGGHEDERADAILSTLLAQRAWLTEALSPISGDVDWLAAYVGP